VRRIALHLPPIYRSVMRWMLVFAIGLSGCATSESTATSEGSASTDECLRDYGQRLGASFCVPIGGACTASPEPLCDVGAGWCGAGMCRAFCREAAPRCATGFVEEHAADAGGDVCMCVPG